MIQDTINKIKTGLSSHSELPPQKKAELLSMVDQLQAEINELAKTDVEQAQSIAGFSAVSTHEATRHERDDQLLQHSLGGLSASVSGFEASHPRLVNLVNSFCTSLSNLGI
jgi:hypothetical protein